MLDSESRRYSEDESFYDQNERDTYDEIKTSLRCATSIEEIKKLEAILDATRRFGGRWDWITWQTCDEPECYMTEAYQGNSYPDPSTWVYCDNIDCDMVEPEREFGGRSTICVDCFEKIGYSDGDLYLCRKCIHIDKNCMELDEHPQRFQHPNPYPKGFK
jgi:hypothetical protein